MTTTDQINPVSSASPDPQGRSAQRLLPCPFCSGKARIHNTDSDYRAVFVVCTQCGANTVCCEYEKGLRPESVKLVVKAWNRRTAPAAVGTQQQDEREAFEKWWLDNRPRNFRKSRKEVMQRAFIAGWQARAAQEKP